MAGRIRATKDPDGFINVAVPEKYRGMVIAEALRLMGIDVDLPCGGDGRCGKCSAYVVKETEAEIKTEYLKLCRATVPNEGTVTVKLDEKMILGEAELDISEPDWFCGGDDISKTNDSFLAVDVGTTTVEAVFRHNGENAAHFAALNPQKKYGADVISRIAFSETEGGLERLTDDIRGLTNGMLKKCRADFPGAEIQNVYVAGNTVMQHLFLGVSPAGIGHYPFTPEFTEAKTVKGAGIGVDAENVTLLPSADSFIGADVVAGAELYLDKDAESVILFIDLGTNGEMVLKANGKYYATSSAAGPCFEGANISCGTGGIEGAISSFKDTDGDLSFKTIGGKPPVGLCGSGLLSLVALLLEKGIIDYTGLMEDDFEINGLLDCGGKKEYFNTGLFLTKKDVREFQLAKAAIRTGIEILLEEGGVTADDVALVLIAGGLGSHIDPESAQKTGIFPPGFENKISTAGNTSLKGAVTAGCDASFITNASRLAAGIKTFSLNDSPDFNEKFVDNMYFD